MAGVDARGVAAEIIRRAARLANSGGGSNHFVPYVVRLSNPPKPHERLQLAANRILRRPVAIMPVKCLTVDEWIERFRQLQQPR
jgi:hypothetical protein